MELAPVCGVIRLGAGSLAAVLVLVKIPDVYVRAIHVRGNEL